MRTLVLALLVAATLPLLAPTADAQACSIHDLSDETVDDYVNCQVARAECAVRSVVEGTFDCPA